MSKITLNNVGSLIDATTAANTINANTAVIQTAFDNTLSLDGTSPNQMQNNFDMNSHQILNLPTPATANSPLRLVDLSSFTGGGTVSNIPAGGTTGQFLAKTSNTDYAIGWTAESADLTAGTNIVLTGSTPTTISTTTTPTFTTVNTATVPTVVDTLVARGTTDTLTNKTLTAPVISSIVNTGTLTLPTSTDTIVGRATTDTLTNKTLTSPTINGATLATSTINGNTITTGTGTLTLGTKTLTASNSLTLAGTDATTLTFQGTDTYVGRTSTDTLTNKTLTSPTINTPTVAGGTHTGVTNLGLRDTSAAFDVTVAATSSTTLTAGRALTLDVGNVAHTVKLGTVAGTITFPNTAADTVAMLGTANVHTAQNTYNVSGIPVVFNSTNSAQNIQMQAAGATTAFFGGATNAPLFVQNPSGVNVVAFNYAGTVAASPSFTSQATGLPVIYGAAGSDTNIDIELLPKGTGKVFTPNLLVSTGPTAGVGYATGAGGTVSQTTGRTTGVTLNKVSGSIALFSQINTAVSAATAQTFTLTNSAIAATDVVHVTQQSGTDKYQIFVTNTAGGSCQITTYTTGGTTNEAPVFNFVVFKGVTS